MSEPSSGIPAVGAVPLMQYDANKKRAAVAYLLWFFLGLFGAHRYYLQRPGSATTLLIYTLVCILLMAVLIGAILLLASVAWVLIDALLIPSIVRDCNNRLAERLRLSEGGATSVAAPPV